jgi:hypothetical protein
MQQKYQKVNEIWPFLTVLPDGAIRRSRADARRLEGERDGFKIQASRCGRFRRSVSNGAEPETGERRMAGLQWGHPAGFDPDGRPQLAAGRKSPSARVRKGNPWGG